jgi:hypothetical protein
MHDAYFATLQSRFSGTADNSPARFEARYTAPKGKCRVNKEKDFFPHCRRHARRRMPERDEKGRGNSTTVPT